VWGFEPVEQQQALKIVVETTPRYSLLGAVIIVQNYSLEKKKTYVMPR
jgi:hypothetical protein